MLNCYILIVLTVLNGRSLTELSTGPPETIVHVLKVGWAMAPQFCPNQLLTKSTLLLFYYRIFSIHKGFVRWLWCIGILTILWTFSAYLVKWIMCWPVAYIWDKSLPGGKCIKMPVFFAVNESVNSAIDFVMIGLAIRIVMSLKMSLYEKIRLSILFSVGSLSGIIGFIKIGEAYSTAYTSVLDPIWDITQMATSIICCCAPVFPSVFAGFKWPKALSSFFSSLRSSKGRSDANTDPSNGEPWVPKNASYPNLANPSIPASTVPDFAVFQVDGHSYDEYEVANTGQSNGISWVPGTVNQPTFAWAQVPVVYQVDGQPSHGYGFANADPRNGVLWVPMNFNQSNIVWTQDPAAYQSHGPPM
ncbi:hypothetical protein DHEL01_v211099 [Diaporthe helianthi]|uniref:Rhodopsin domain-containing protein n=1 Tax=Diaporthe helianthi TaxID=158607 RepID=A0A2P5HJS0_DIAHE|nr:hypothetical protein DHEL01_v211099 [Diaporthe helianthi]